MFLKYIILRLKIFKRYLFDELSMVGVVLLLLLVILIANYIIKFIIGHEFWRYICISLFSFLAILNSSNRKDKVFLKTQGINVIKFRIIGNILFSTIFWFFDYRLIPLFLCASISIPFVVNKLHLKSNNRIVISPFLKGSFEWISGFRAYILLVFVFAVILMGIGILYNNQVFVSFWFVFVSIVLSFLFVNHEPYFYIRQYNTVNCLLKAKIRHIIWNYAIICTPLILLHSIFFFEETAMLIVYSAFGILTIVGNLFLKYIYYLNEYLRQLLQMVMVGLFIAACVYPQFVVFLLLFVVISYVKSVKRLKELYYDESK